MRAAGLADKFLGFVTFTPLAPLLGVFLLLCVLNVFAAPFSRGSVTLRFPPSGWLLEVPAAWTLATQIPWAWVMIGRPLLGMALFAVMVGYARGQGRAKLETLLAFTCGLALLVAFLALGSTQWNSKSYQLRFLINLLPVYKGFPGAEGGFNANEIAGAIAWLTPLAGGLALVRWRPRLLQAGLALAFWLLLLAVFLGQSRLAIGGVVVALGALIFLLIPAGRRRTLALAGLVLLVAAEAVIVTNVLSPARVEQTADRDEVSTNRRLEMWQQALAIARDYPLTGVGMNMYRDRQVRARYPVSSYESRVLPHAHNEFLQVAADLGLPGMLVFVGWYGAAGYMLFQTWRRGAPPARAVAAAAAAGLLAHALYGMGDAVALWDRFAFVFWWLLGIAGAQYVLVKQRAVSD